MSDCDSLELLLRKLDELSLFVDIEHKETNDFIKTYALIVENLEAEFDICDIIDDLLLLVCPEEQIAFLKKLCAYIEKADRADKKALQDKAVLLNLLEEAREVLGPTSKIDVVSTDLDEAEDIAKEYSLTSESRLRGFDLAMLKASTQLETHSNHP